MVDEYRGMEQERLCAIRDGLTRRQIRYTHTGFAQATMAPFRCYIATLQHLRARQMAYRVLRPYRYRYAVWCAHHAFRASPSCLQSSEASGAAQRLGALLKVLGDTIAQDTVNAVVRRFEQKTFAYLGHTRKFADAITWNNPDLPLLWRYHQHYHDELRYVVWASAGDGTARRNATEFVRGWVRDNPLGKGVGWHPYVIARRLQNWCLCASDLGLLENPDMARSAQQQAEVLAGTVEHDLSANHVFREYAAMVITARCLGVGSWRVWFDALMHEVSEQILPDGGHYERSPLYHMECLEDLLCVAYALDSPSAALCEAIEKMAAFLQGLLHPDNDIPLFGDAYLGHIPPPLALIRAAFSLRGRVGTHPPSFTHYSKTGYVVVRRDSSGMTFIFKAGEPGPPHQLGHAHSDPLSYELAWQGVRWIVDSGTHGYAESVDRNHCRGTAAHNTVRINGDDSLELWKTFRVGRRYHPLYCTAEETAQGAFLLSAAYRTWRGAEHRRVIRGETAHIRIEDEVTARGPVHMESFVHFHPSVSVFREGHRWCLERGEARLWLIPDEGLTCTLLSPASDNPKTLYFPSFGCAEPCYTLVMESRGKGTLRSGYTILLNAALAP